MKLLTFYDKEISYPLGYVADFCPIEREITVERIDAVHASRYLTFVRLDRGALVRHDRVCVSCGLTIPDERYIYPELAPTAVAALADLEARTNPGVSERNRDLIVLHREIARGAHFDREIKTALLKEQFALLDQIAETHWSGQTNLDRTSLTVGLLSVALSFGSLVFSSKLPTEEQRMAALPYAGALILGLIIVSAVVFFLGPRRVVNRQVLPIMAAALRPLKPSQPELDALLVEMRAEGFRHATKVKSGRLLKLIQARR
jgi:hypothetical protein